MVRTPPACSDPRQNTPAAWYQLKTMSPPTCRQAALTLDSGTSSSRKRAPGFPRFWHPSTYEIASHQQIRSKHMIKPSVFTRVIVLTLTSALTLSATLAQQDISGGAGSLLAGAEVEAKLGKGI